MSITIFGLRNSNGKGLIKREQTQCDGEIYSILRDGARGCRLRS